MHEQVAAIFTGEAGGAYKPFYRVHQGSFVHGQVEAALLQEPGWQLPCKKPKRLPRKALWQEQIDADVTAIEVALGNPAPVILSRSVNRRPVGITRGADRQTR